jgi:hypothetical protein
MSDRDVIVGQNLAKLRGDRTQQDIAEAMRDAGYKWSQATVWSVEKGERPIRLSEAESLAGILKCTIDRMLLPDQDAELVSRLWKSDHELFGAGRELAKAVRDYEDRWWQLRFVVDEMTQRMPEMASTMKPNITLKMQEAERKLRAGADHVVRQELAEYRAAFDEGDDDSGEHSEA